MWLDATSLSQFAQGRSLGDDQMYKDALFVKHSTAVVSILTVAVGLLEKGEMETLVSVLRDLGARHASFNLGKDLVGKSLLFTPSQLLAMLLLRE